MLRRRCALIVLCGLLLPGMPVPAGAETETPRIRKPMPAPPPTPAEILNLPPAYFDPNLAVAGEDVKARKIESRLSVEVRVNGTGPYRFIVDSGADTSVVGLRIARNLQLPLGTPATLNGMTARNIVDRVHVAELKLGSTAISNLQLPALREYDLGGDGMIGIDALHKQRLMMDFEKRMIKVEDASIPAKRMPDEIVVVGRLQRGQLILTHVRAGGLPLDAVIDTGSEITIGNSALRDKLIRGNRDKFVTIPVTGVTGKTVDLQFAKIAELQLGPVVLRDVPMAFADVPPFKLFGLADQPALLLGTDILETFRRISLDFKARKVRFQLRSCQTQGILISTSPSSFTRIGTNGDSTACAR